MSRPKNTTTPLAFGRGDVWRFWKRYTGIRPWRFPKRHTAGPPPGRFTKRHSLTAARVWGPKWLTLHFELVVLKVRDSRHTGVSADVSTVFKGAK